MNANGALFSITLVFAAFFMGRCSAPDEGWRQQARALEAEVDGLTLERDALVGHLDSLITESVISDSVYSADSTRWALEHEAHEDRIAVLTADASVVADSIRAHVDSIGAEWFDAYIAHQDSIEAHYGAQILLLQSQVVAIWEQRETLREIATALSQHNEINRRIIMAQDAELDIMRRAANPGMFEKLKRGVGPLVVGVTAGTMLALTLAR